MARKRQKKKKSGWISRLILIAAVIVFVVSGFSLFQILRGYQNGDEEYEKIRDLAIQTGEDTEDAEDSDSFRVDFDKLLEINPDTVGWIRFYPEPSQISYPIVQGEDNEEYLHKTFSSSENTLGAIFLDEKNSSLFDDANSVIYGHRMKNGSMFRHLLDYNSRKFWAKYPYFYIYTVDGRKLSYRIYSVGEVTANSPTYDIQFADNADFEDFIQLTKRISAYDTALTPSVTDTIVTLSTCTSASDDKRFVVRGVKINEETLSETNEE